MGGYLIWDCGTAASPTARVRSHHWYSRSSMMMTMLPQSLANANLGVGDLGEGQLGSRT